MKRLYVYLLLAFLGVMLLSTLTRSYVLSELLNRAKASAGLQEARADSRAIAAWAVDRWERQPDDLRYSLTAMARVAGARVWLVDLEGRVRVDTQQNPSWEGARIEGQELTRAMKGIESVVQGRSPWLESAMAVVVPVTREHRIIGVVFLFVPQPLEDSSLTANLLTSAAIALLVSAVAAFLLSRLIASPVERITSLARRLGQRDFDASVQVSSITEVNQLADTLTETGRKLDHSFRLLSEERQRLAFILQSMQDGVLAIDGHETLVLANDAAVRLLDWPAPPPLPSPAAQIQLPAQLSQALREAAAGRTVEVHLQPRGKRDYLALCLPVSAETGDGGAVAVLRDLEEVMRLQRAREKFVADLAHELRGPLANISLITEALEDGTAGWADRTPFLRRLRAEVDRLTRLSRDVLDLARIDAGVVAPALTPIALAPLVEEMVEELRGRPEARGLTLESAISPDLHVLASQGHLEQTLYNLLENGLRYTPKGGWIRVSARRDGERVKICVADSGSGIPPEHLPYVFDRFYKVDPARTSGNGGTGLGLAVVKQLVQLQQGRITLESRPGEGATFLIDLAAAGAEE